MFGTRGIVRMKLVAFQRKSRPVAGWATSSTHLYRIRRMKGEKENKKLAYHSRGTKKADGKGAAGPKGFEPLTLRFLQKRDWLPTNAVHPPGV